MELAPITELITGIDIPRLLSNQEAIQTVSSILAFQGDPLSRSAPTPSSSLLWDARLFMQPQMNEEAFLSLDRDGPSESDINAIWPQRTPLWNSDSHLLAQYYFLSDEENSAFAAYPQKYLYVDTSEFRINDITSSERVELPHSHGMVSNWMWFLRRSDAYATNNWSNYTASKIGPVQMAGWYGKIANTDFANGQPYPLDEPIMKTWALLINGEYRENTFAYGVYGMLEAYESSKGVPPPGLYCYDFGVTTSDLGCAPSGAMNLSTCGKVEFEIAVREPARNPNTFLTYLCDNAGGVIGVDDTSKSIYMYTYDMFVYEERYNVMTFEGGVVGLLYTR